MKKILTISIAAYNVQDYIEKLLESIIATEMYSELEVIVVNDGSQDKTVELVKKYVNRYPETVFLIDKKNGGHGSTINEGIKNAHGDYFKVIDGDDWVEPEELKKLVNKLKKCSSDLVFCNFKNVYENTNTEKIIKMGIESNKEFKFDEISEKLDKLCFHNIYIKTKILQDNSIKLQENCFYVDNELDCYPIPFVETVINYDFTVYCYRLGREGQSVSLKSLQKNEKQRLMVITNLLMFYKNYKGKISLSKQKFIEKFISIMVGSQIDIMFSWPLSIKKLKEIIEFDNKIKETPGIYQYMHFSTFKLWRKQRTLLYFPIWMWCKYKNSKKF